MDSKEQISFICLYMKKKTSEFSEVFFMVAGAGLEPTTFGL